MRPSSRQTCSQVSAPLSVSRLPIVAASCPSGAPNSVSLRGCSASERARAAKGFTSLPQNALSALQGGEGGDPSRSDGEGEVGSRRAPWNPPPHPNPLRPPGAERERAPPCAQVSERSARSLSPLLDHLVGAREQRLRNRQSERLRGLEVDRQLEFGRLLNRQIGRVG